MVTSQECHHIDYPFKELLSAVIPSCYLIKNLSVLDKQDPFAIAGCKRIMGNHQNSGFQFLIQLSEIFQQHAGGLGIQSACRLICQYQGRICYDCSCAGYTLLLSP